MSFRALLLEEKDGKVAGTISAVDEAKLPAGDVTVAVEYTTLNYKDGLILANKARLVRQYPHIPGIDFAGTVTESGHSGFKPGFFIGFQRSGLYGLCAFNHKHRYNIADPVRFMVCIH
ncbi:MAG: putative acrylyl-CoA reductase AcuI [Firmicutes bacterium ADurb.Bin262]|nr:MAG: putative acrylyl-CoA reductase AcuI [Firmicutes bacterium ADurb.Bin262]